MDEWSATRKLLFLRNFISWIETALWDIGPEKSA